MRFMVLVKANAESEAGLSRRPAFLADQARYDDRLVRAGVLLAGDRLHPTLHAIRVRFSGSCREVIPGPFPDDGELLAGYWLLQVRSEEEAIEWVRRIPNPSGGEQVIEIRQVRETIDGGPASRSKAN